MCIYNFFIKLIYVYNIFAVLKIIRYTLSNVRLKSAYIK